MSNKMNKGNKHGSNPIQPLVEEISGLIVLVINNIAKLSAKGMVALAEQVGKKSNKRNDLISNAKNKLSRIKGE